MTKRKLQRFAETETFGNVFHKQCEFKGNWNTSYFRNENPIVLELGCGRGEYTVNMGQKMPKKNFIGIDIKGARLWRGAKTAYEEGMKNIAFLRIQIETIENFFAPGEVSELWITFPDPQIQVSRARKRLTSPRFLNHYHQILRPGGRIHLKTDSRELYEFTLEMIERYGLILHNYTHDLYGSQLLDDTLSIQTKYESVYLREGKNIHYLCFSLPENYQPIDWKEAHKQARGSLDEPTK
ncbi:tRNA (guanine-N7-)-methyltransferase [Anseongella ginsenosidimutans]|uniref:tRNA (guanine-N(7)-)-methyltransferase n=2 Tax=Anseongella ginsenosidimutans TaxID=496056 RepID=A0A4R3KWP6_9SPHI|nr:tRNA (guanosine(46)-N7)-methyltransferase TrmB [Anseongella ginsenosidimutans]TCS89156.1 tRNA (guanine-N7-)-methyltransferase [Anseongella ginsenosidimutans]